MDYTNPEHLNRMLRPAAIFGLIVLAFVFLTSLGCIMLFRYAAFGEISWEGLSAFIVGVVGPIVQHFQNRHALYKYGRIAPTPEGGLVNNVALT